MEIESPQTEEDLLKVVQAALGEGKSLEVLGHGTKRTIGHPIKADRGLSLKSLSGILAYEPGELVLSAWAGTPMAEIEEALTAEGQCLAFEPPDYSNVIGGAGKGTLGGHIAAALSGPRRLSAGGPRDHVLGVVGVTGRGEAFKIGGRVVKNVTGYDLSKLLTGSFGTLAVMSRITMKVLPRAEASRTLVVQGEMDELLTGLRKGAASPFAVTGAAIREGRALLRLEGRGDEVDERARFLDDNLKMESLILDSEASKRAWSAVRDLEGVDDEEVIWRINLPRVRAPEILHHLEAEEKRCLVDWAGARIWTGDIPNLRGKVQSLGGKAMLFKGPGEMKERVSVFHPEPKPLAALSRNIKDAFDPESILNPGRMGT